MTVFVLQKHYCTTEEPEEGSKWDKRFEVRHRGVMHARCLVCECNKRDIH